MAINILDKKSIGNSPFIFFASSNLVSQALSERKGDQSSSQSSGLPQLTPFNTERSASYRLYLLLQKEGGPEALAKFLKQVPALAEALLKHLSHDARLVSTLSNSIKAELSTIVKQNNISENLQLTLSEILKPTAQKSLHYSLS